MSEFLSALLVTVAGAALASACSTGFSAREKRWVALSFLMHVGFACVQVPITLSFYGGGDMFLYFRYGEVLAELMNHDAGHFVPEVTALLFHRPNRLPLEIIGAGGPTGSMSALAAWAFYILGPSKYAACIAFAMLSLSGKIALYRVFRANVDQSHRRYAGVATLFVPSFVFWSAGMLKEAIALTGLGWSLLGLHLWIGNRKSLTGLALMAAAALPISLIKPYILFPFVVAGAAWYYWTRSIKLGRIRIRPLYLGMAGVLSIGGIVILGHYFPEYSVDAFSSRTAELQQLGRVVQGGSDFELGSETPTTLAGQLAYAPLALLSTLFRPALFEVHNALMLANAAETTLFTLLLLRIAFTRNWWDVRRQMTKTPFLVFCLVFVITFGLAVGLASTNLGTLSRYRAPLLPFFAVLLLVLGKPLRKPSAESPDRVAEGTAASRGAIVLPNAPEVIAVDRWRSRVWGADRES